MPVLQIAPTIALQSIHLYSATLMVLAAAVAVIIAARFPGWEKVRQTLAAISFGKFLSLLKSENITAHERELYFQSLAEAAGDIIWTADTEGSDDYFNQRMFDYTGMTFEQLRGGRWTAIVHEDDVDECLTKWDNARRTGTPYQIEYRLRAKDGSYRWFVCHGNPIRNAQGEIVKWFGTCTDIEYQKQNQQILEEQIQERTMQLAEMNARLQEEMAEKDLAHKQLDEQNKKMLRDLEKRSERATMLAKVGELLQSCISREEVIAAALGFAPKIFPEARGALVFLDSARNLAEVAGSWNDCHLTSREFDASACWALRTGHVHLVAAADNTARCAHTAGMSGAYICIPILVQGETLGVLHLQATKDWQIETAELSFKTTFAGQVGISIANIRLRDALRTQSVRDALTGLYNRRFLEELLERELRRANRSAQSLGILMIDLDHFKSFNDTFGHEAGDAVLRETADLLLKSVRAEDFVCRFGGEEFVIVLPTAALSASISRGERLRSRIKQLTILHQGKSMGMLTISVGVAVFPEHGSSPKELLAAADAALYEAKHNGRDQVRAAHAKVLQPIAGPDELKPTEGNWA